MATEAGRQPEALDAALLGLGLRLANGPIDGERRTFTGSAEQICDDIRGFEAQGLGTLVVAFESNDLNQSLDQLSAFADSVMAQCRP